MVGSLLSRYQTWKEARDKPKPKKKYKKSSKAGKPERTNKSKNGFKYKLKLDYIPIQNLQGHQGNKMVQKLLPNKVDTGRVERRLGRALARFKIAPVQVMVEAVLRARIAARGRS